MWNSAATSLRRSGSAACRRMYSSTLRVIRLPEESGFSCRPRRMASHRRRRQARTSSSLLANRPEPISRSISCVLLLGNFLHSMIA